MDGTALGLMGPEAVFMWGTACGWKEEAAQMFGCVPSGRGFRGFYIGGVDMAGVGEYNERCS